MVQYQNILAAVGVGAEAHRVLSRAQAVAKTKGARLTMLHVVRRRFGKEMQPVTLQTALEQPEWGLGEQARRELAAMRDGLDGSELTLLVAAGHPARMILGTVRERGVDFLVMGSHSRHGITGYLGSTTDYVAHGADCDVLVVKAQGREHQAVQGGYRSLLVPVDFSADSWRIVERAVVWAEHYGAQLTLLHIEEHFPVDRSNECITPEDQDPAEDLEQRARASMTDLAQAAGVQAAAQEFQLCAGAAKHAIVAVAEQWGTDLIVMGSHGVRGPGSLLGSTTDGVLHRSPCDVLLVRVRGSG